MIKLLSYSLKQSLAKGLKPGTAKLPRAPFVQFPAQNIYPPSLSQNAGGEELAARLTRNLTTLLISKGSAVIGTNSSFRPSQGSAILNNICR